MLLAKNLPKRQLLPIIFPRMVLDGIAGINFALSGSPKNTWAILKAHMSFYKSLPQLPRVRKQLPSTKKFPNMMGVMNHSIVYKHFLGKKKCFNDL